MNLRRMMEPTAWTVFAMERLYFLLAHVWEWSDVKRVNGILEKLGWEFEDAPLDVFLAMAGVEPTFEERFPQR